MLSLGDPFLYGDVKFIAILKPSPSCDGIWLHDEADMAEIVNLRRFKKHAAREQSATQAETNRARYGRTKPERALEERLAARTSDLLDQHRITSEEAS